MIPYCLRMNCICNNLPTSLFGTTQSQIYNLVDKFALYLIQVSLIIQTICVAFSLKNKFAI